MNLYMDKVKRAVTSAVSSFSPTPSVVGPEAWAIKGACMAAQSYLLAATSHGLATAPMEGFDGRRIRQVVLVVVYW